MENLERAVELFHGVLGMDVLSRGPSALVRGEMATVDAGGCVITLLEPASSGDGTILSERTPRLSQIVLASGTETTQSLRHGAVAAGLAVVPLDGAAFYVTPEAAAGALGQSVAVVVTAVDGA